MIIYCVLLATDKGEEVMLTTKPTLLQEKILSSNIGEEVKIMHFLIVPD